MLDFKNAFLVVLLSTCLAPVAGSAKPRGDWPTFGYDQQRSGWNQAETGLSTKNVAHLKLLWSAKLGTAPSETALSTLTAPVVGQAITTVEGEKQLVFVLGADDSVFAIDANSGRVVWRRQFPNPVNPQRPASWLCPNTPNGTPVIDRQRGVLFFNASDGKLRALDLADGEERMSATPFVLPYSRNWSLNLIGDVVYTAAGRGCGGNAQTNIESGNVAAMDVGDLAHPTLTRLYTGHGRPAGPWSRSGPVKSSRGILVQTADGLYDPASGSFGNTLIEVAPRAETILDSFTPSNWRYMNAKDLDLGAGSPIVFPFQNHTLVATAAKEGILYLLDGDALGGGAPEHSKPLYESPKLGNDRDLLAGFGVWGAMATYENAKDERYLYVPMWGPSSKNASQFKYSYGDASHGSIMAFQVTGGGAGISLTPVWESRDLAVPDTPTVANGVVYAVQTGEQSLQGPIPRPKNWAELRDKYRATPVTNEVLYAFDAETGKELYSSGKTLTDWVHFSEPVVALDKVFLVSHDGHVYAFGLKR